jgi:hypothetical protein
LVEKGETRDIGSIGVNRNTQAYGVLGEQPEKMNHLADQGTEKNTILSDIKRI